MIRRPWLKGKDTKTEQEKEEEWKNKGKERKCFI